jgi:hypothetical protein
MWYLASIVLLAIVIRRVIKKDNRKAKSEVKSFWERERAANNVRRKPLDDLPYVIIPLDQLPMNILTDRHDIRECAEQIQNLAGQKIANFTGYTNTDLKLMYGAANLTLLTEYDQNYTLLVRTLQKWADLLLKSGYIREGRQIMEYAVGIGTDVSKTYFELASLYQAEGENEQIGKLIETAQNLQSVSRRYILKHLEDLAQTGTDKMIL